MDLGQVMNLVVTAVGALVVLGVVAGAFFFSKAQGGIAAAGGGPVADGARALSDALSQRLGYTSIVEGSLATVTRPGETARTHMVRSVAGRTLDWASETTMGSSSYATSMRWSVRLGSPARIPLHLAHARLAGVGVKVADAMMSRRRVFQPRYPTPVSLAGTMLADGFVAYTMPGYEGMVAQLLSDPGLATSIAALPHVDVVIEPGLVSLDDGFQEGLATLLGGPTNLMRMFTPEGIERVVWLHQAIAEALCRLADRVR